MTKIIGFTGLKGAGKNAAAKVLEDRGYTDVKFAGALKEMLRTFLRYRGVDDLTIERMVEGDLKEVPTPFIEGKTPRQFMQWLGTEFGRGMLGEDVWINCFRDRSKLFDKVVCSDVRFPNEVDVIISGGGEVYRVVRDTDVNAFSGHASEKHIPSLPVTAEIDNTGTLYDLFTKIDGLI